MPCGCEFKVNPVIRRWILPSCFQICFTGQTGCLTGRSFRRFHQYPLVRIMYIMLNQINILDRTRRKSPPFIIDIGLSTAPNSLLLSGLSSLCGESGRPALESPPVRHSCYSRHVPGPSCLCHSDKIQPGPTGAGPSPGATRPI